MTELIDAVQQLGFPIAVAAFFLWRLMVWESKLLQQLSNIAIQLQRLNDAVHELSDLIRNQPLNKRSEK